MRLAICILASGLLIAHTQADEDGSTPPPTDPAPEKGFHFKDRSAAQEWRPVNDTVMGGVSSSSVKSGGDGTLLFRGDVSLENNGGFASIRREADAVDWSDADGIEVRVRGDGKRYRVVLRQAGQFSWVSYQQTFNTTAGEWTTVRLPYKDFEPGWRGRAVPAAPPMDGMDLVSMGFLIADKQEGPFQLEIEFLHPFRI